MLYKNYIVKIIFLGLSLGSYHLHAQNKPITENKKNTAVKPSVSTKPMVANPEKTDTSKTDVSQQIEVVRAYKPVLAEAVKIRISPDLNNNTSSAKLNYNLLDKRLEQNSEIRKLDIQKVVAIGPDELKNNFVKLGVGNLGTTLGQLNLATGQDQALIAGFNFNHLAQKGKLPFQNTSQQSATAYGKSIGDVFVLGGQLHYNRQALNYYGQTETNTLINTNPNNQVYSVYAAEANLYNRVDENDENKLVFSSKVDGYYLKNNFNATESGIILSTGISKNLNKFQLGVSGLVDFTNTNDSAYTLKNHIFKINPYIKLDGNRFRLSAGINYTNEFGSNQRIYIFPKANVDYVLIKDYLTLFGSITGDVNKTKLTDVISINPFLNTNILIKNTVEKLNIAGGVVGTIVPNIGFKAMVKSTTVTDFQYFVNNPLHPEKFDVAYDSGNSQILNFTGEVNLKFSERFLLTGNLEFNQYDLSVEKYAWFNPTLKLSTTAQVKILPELSLGINAYHQSLSKGKISSIDSSVTEIKTLDAFIDLGISLNYHYNKKIAAFVKTNNLLGTEYQRYLYYPSFGLNILGGFTFSF